MWELELCNTYAIGGRPRAELLSQLLYSAGAPRRAG